jgi:hypothetical protein
VEARGKGACWAGCLLGNLARQRLYGCLEGCAKRTRPDEGGELLLIVNDEWRWEAIARRQAAEPHSEQEPGARLTSLWTRASPSCESAHNNVLAAPI